MLRGSLGRKYRQSGAIGLAILALVDGGLLVGSLI